MLSSTASRLLHNRHPRQMTSLTTMNTLDNAVNMVSGKQQARANKFGDAFSKKESTTILKSVSSGYDAPVLALKEGVEFLYTGPGMSGCGARWRKATAMRLGIYGYMFFGDNVGRVRRCIFLLFCNILFSVSSGTLQQGDRELQLILAADNAHGCRKPCPDSPPRVWLPVAQYETVLNLNFQQPTPHHSPRS